MKINSKGFWENSTAEGHKHDPDLAAKILEILKHEGATTLVDFGCGTGEYARFFKENGIYVEAYDGNPNTVELSGGIASVLDLSQEFDLDEGFDCVMSLEVGEHIPKEFEQTFISNICRHSFKPGLTIISWAVPGQPGDGHINCRPNRYIIQEMGIRGFEFDLETSVMLRKAAFLPWFKNTIMVFK